MKTKYKPVVFLGGTCNGSTWRDQLIPLLKDVECFNPVVKDWTPECQQKEIEMRGSADYVLYLITPKMTGFYSIAEAVDDSNNRRDKTIFCFLDKDEDSYWEPHQLKSLIATGKLIEKNGGVYIKYIDIHNIASSVNHIFAIANS